MSLTLQHLQSKVSIIDMPDGHRLAIATMPTDSILDEIIRATLQIAHGDDDGAYTMENGVKKIQNKYLTAASVFRRFLLTFYTYKQNDETLIKLANFVYEIDTLLYSEVVDVKQFIKDFEDTANKYLSPEPNEKVIRCIEIFIKTNQRKPFD